MIDAAKLPPAPPVSAVPPPLQPPPGAQSPPSRADAFAQHLERAGRSSPSAGVDGRQARPPAARDGAVGARDRADADAGGGADAGSDSDSGSGSGSGSVDAGNASAVASERGAAARAAARNQRSSADRQRPPAGERRAANAGEAEPAPTHDAQSAVPARTDGAAAAAADPAALLAGLMALAHGQRPLPAPAPATTVANAARPGGTAGGIGDAGAARDAAAALTTAGGAVAVDDRGAAQPAFGQALAAAGGGDADGKPALQAAADAAPTLPAVRIDAWPAGQLRAADNSPQPAAGSAAPVRQTQLPAAFGTPAFAPGLGAEISVMLKDGVREARLQLNPAEMGPISVRIDIDGSNAQVQMAAERADTRAALEQAMPELAGALRDNGLTLTGGGVFEQPGPPPERGGAAGGTDGGGGRKAGAGSSGSNGDSRDGDRGAGGEPQRTAAAGARLQPRGGVDLYA